MYLPAVFGGYRSYENGDINSHINSYVNTSERSELTNWSAILRDFQNQEYGFTTLKSRIWLPEKLVKEHKQLQRVTRFGQTQ